MTAHFRETARAFDPRTRPDQASEVESSPRDERRARPPRRFLGRKILLMLAAAGLVGLVVVLFSPDPQPVDTAVAASGGMTVSVTSEGKTRVKQEYEVTAPLAGRLRRVPLKAGDRVVADQTVVAIIDPPRPQFNDVRLQAELEAKMRAADSSLSQAQADLLRAQAQLQFAEEDVTRYRDLAATGVTAKRSYNQYVMEAQIRRAAVQVAEKMVDQRKAEVEQVRAQQLGPGGPGQEPVTPPVQVRSPVSGYVLDVAQESETVLTPGQRIMLVGDVSKIEVMLEMLSEDAVKVRAGMDARIEGWGGTPLNGRVRLVEPYSYTKISALGIEEQRVHVLLDFTDPPEKWQAIGHGYRVTGRIITWVGDDVLKLPMGALFRDGPRWAVYAIENGTARLRHVELGHINQTEAEVLGGVTAGTQVILHASDRIADGVPVRARTGSQSGGQ